FGIRRTGFGPVFPGFSSPEAGEAECLTPCSTSQPSENRSRPGLLALGRRLGYKEPMDTRGRARPARPTTRLPTPMRRFVLAWAVMIGGLVGFWFCRPWLGTKAFNY